MAARPGPTRKQEQSDDTRARLVDSATKLFAARGYRDTSVQAIGEMAGISRGSIFWHFGSKEGLLWAVVERAFTRWESETLVPDIGDAVGLEAVRRGVRSHHRFLTEDAEALRLFYVLMFEALGPRPELAARFADLHRHLRRLLREPIAAGIASGEMRSGLAPETVITIIAAALGGIVYQHLLDPRGFDLEATYAQLVEVLERGLA